MTRAAHLTNEDIAAALSQTGGYTSRAARLLGVNASTLNHRVKHTPQLAEARKASRKHKPLQVPRTNCPRCGLCYEYSPRVAVLNVCYWCALETVNLKDSAIAKLTIDTVI